MREYVLMTDSCCDLTDHMAKELELNVVPLTVHMDGKDYANLLDGSEISFEDFYKNIRAGILGTTSAANVGQFEDAMRAVLAQGKDIVSINFSSALSATYQNAVIAAKTMADESPDSRVYVVDSLSASLGQGLLLYLAVQKKREGLSAEELVQWVEENKLHIDHWFTVDDLNYLKMGGRLSAGAAFFGSMLSIKPVITITDGVVELLGKARGSKNGRNLLTQQVEAAGGIDFSMPIELAYAGLDDALLRKYVEDSRHIWEGHVALDDLPVHTVGATIGTHVGPGAIALAFFKR